MQELKEIYLRCRARSIHICAPLQTEDYSLQVVKFASPPKWHLAHTTWFFEEMILKNTTDYQLFNPDFTFLFNSYYNTIGSRVTQGERGFMSRPPIDQVYLYRAHVDKAMESLLSKGITKKDRELILVGINHEEQHQELLFTDIKMGLSVNPLFPVYDANINLVDSQLVGDPKWLKVDEGVYEIGHASEDFCYDNELGGHKVFLNEFEICSELVSVGDYLEFVESDAYHDFKYWLDAGWQWIQEQEISAPLYWRKMDGKWYQFTLGGIKELDLKAPVAHISYYEANAYATWKGARLPTEFEWEIASNQFKWGSRWEWTNSAYLPYPNFKIAEGALGEYNGKFMINQMILRGASVATTPGHSRKTYRNFFSPETRWQFSGIRLAK